MSLTDALTQAKATLAGTCPLRLVRDDLPADEQAILDAALADGSPSLAIAAALTQTDHRIAATDVRDHRAGDCPCAIQTGA